MSCHSISGILHTCSSNQGGIKNIYISNEKIDELFTLKNILLTPEYLHSTPSNRFMDVSFVHPDGQGSGGLTDQYFYNMQIITTYPTPYQYGVIPKGSFIKHMVYEKGCPTLADGLVGYTPHKGIYFEDDPEYVNFWPYDTATEEDDKKYYILGKDGKVSKGGLSGTYFRTPVDMNLQLGQCITKIQLTETELVKRTGHEYIPGVGFYWGRVFLRGETYGCPDMYWLWNPDMYSGTPDRLQVNVEPVFCGDKINWFQYHMRKEQSSFTFNQTKDVCKTELRFKLNKMDRVKRDELLTLLRSEEIHIIVTDNNGKNWVLGADGNLEVEEITGQTGQKKEDGNYFEIKLTDYSHDMPKIISDDDLNRCNIQG